MALVVQNPAIAAMTKKGGKKKEDVGIDDSSFLMGASYDPATAQLTITMKSGSVYTYSNIDQSKFESFKQSRNKGKFYSDEIKGIEEGTRTVDKTVGKAVKKT